MASNTKRKFSTKLFFLPIVLIFVIFVNHHFDLVALSSFRKELTSADKSTALLADIIIHDSHESRVTRSLTSQNSLEGNKSIQQQHSNPIINTQHEFTEKNTNRFLSRIFLGLTSNDVSRVEQYTAQINVKSDSTAQINDKSNIDEFYGLNLQINELRERRRILHNKTKSILQDINTSFKFFFTHIQRSGGSSIENQILKNWLGNKNLPLSATKNIMNCQGNFHARFNDMDHDMKSKFAKIVQEKMTFQWRHCPYGLHIFLENEEAKMNDNITVSNKKGQQSSHPYLYMTMLRNGRERLISWWKFCRSEDPYTGCSTWDNKRKIKVDTMEDIIGISLKDFYSLRQQNLEKEYPMDTWIENPKKSLIHWLPKPEVFYDKLIQAPAALLKKSKLKEKPRNNFFIYKNIKSDQLPALASLLDDNNMVRMIGGGDIYSKRSPIEKEDLIQAEKNLLDSYSFILILERLDESKCLLEKLTGIKNITLIDQDAKHKINLQKELNYIKAYTDDSIKRDIEDGRAILDKLGKFDKILSDFGNLLLDLDLELYPECKQQNLTKR